jgi:hypothetical protein
MSILTAREIWCDGCAQWVRLDSGELMSEVWPELSKKGWSRKGGEHWCEECTLKKEEETGDR